MQSPKQENHFEHGTARLISKETIYSLENVEEHARCSFDDPIDFSYEVSSRMRAVGTAA